MLSLSYFRFQKRLFFSHCLNSVNRIGSLRSQTQYSDISFEKRSPKATIRLSIRQHPNGTYIQPNAQIALDGLYKEKNNNNQNYQNGNARINLNNQSSFSNKSSPKSAQSNHPDEDAIANDDQCSLDNKSDEQISDAKNKCNPIDECSADRNEENNKIKNNGDHNLKKDKSKFENQSTDLFANKQLKTNQIELPRLEKLIQNEIDSNQLPRKLTRCSTSVEFDGHTSSGTKIAKNRKLISSDTIP